jgi:hypothetical protein
MVIAIVTANTIGIGTGEIAAKPSSSGKNVTTTTIEAGTTTVVRTATDRELRNAGGLPPGGPLCFVVSGVGLKQRGITFFG